MATFGAVAMLTIGGLTLIALVVIGLVAGYRRDTRAALTGFRDAKAEAAVRQANTADDPYDFHRNVVATLPESIRMDFMPPEEWLDRRNFATGGPTRPTGWWQRCGTPRGYYDHQMYRERPCKSCRQARLEQEYSQRRRYQHTTGLSARALNGHAQLTQEDS